MARLIGVVSKVIGQVYAVGADGGRRLLVDGDRVYAGESLDTGASGAVAVSLQGGGDLTLGRGSSLELTPQLLAGQAPELHIADAAPGTTPLTDVEQLQQAIAAGDDPTLNAEPTAAGPTAPSAPGNANGTGGLGGGHSFVLLTEVGGTVDPVVGFGTEGLNNPQEFPNPDIGTLLSVQAALPPGTPTNPGTPNNPVQINGLDTDGGEQRVFEANLPDGSAPDAAALTRTGSFSVTAADGLATLTIDGVSVIANGALAGDRVTITGQLGNTLVITGYDPTTQTLTYEYTLNDREQHPAGSPPGDDLSEDFYVVATDTDGDSDDAWLNVRIQDDSPTARDDSATVSDHSTTASGTVLSNDTLGADYQANPVTAETIKTDYGTLVLNANGTYTYTLDTSSDAYKLIKVGDTVV
ncbi:retention module-containing protein, partial [Pseudomonas sp. NPDC007930]|uniref:retention module-containing protein n=1 Tax=Pseudomonas sp. NPDC007930 TaxID=3364417 RepID=UPI0036E0D5FA